MFPLELCAAMLKAFPRRPLHVPQTPLRKGGPRPRIIAPSELVAAAGSGRLISGAGLRPRSPNRGRRREARPARDCCSEAIMADSGRSRRFPQAYSTAARAYCRRPRRRACPAKPARRSCASSFTARNMLEVGVAAGWTPEIAGPCSRQAGGIAAKARPDGIVRNGSADRHMPLAAPSNVRGGSVSRRGSSSAKLARCARPLPSPA